MLNLKNPTKYSDFGKNLFEPVHLNVWFFLGKPILLQQKAWLNARRKAQRTRYCLEPGR